MKKACAVLILLAAASSWAGEPWKLTLNLNGNLSYLSKDWADQTTAGKFAWALMADGTAEKQFTSKLNSKTMLKLGFGQTKGPGEIPQKSTDFIDLESILKLTLGGWVDPFISVRGVSQFADNYDTYDTAGHLVDRYTRYINPTMISEVLGAMRTLVKNEELVWDIRLGAAAKQKIDRWAPSNNWETVVTNDGGAEMVTELNTKMLKNQVALKSTFRLYEAIFRGGSDTLDNDWRYPDINWQIMLSTTVAKVMMVGYTIECVYERESNANIQFRHALAVGITLKAPKPEAAAPAAE